MTAPDRQAEESMVAAHSADEGLEVRGLLPACLYEGRVFHKRFRPAKHSLGYRVFALWFDPERIRELAGNNVLLSYNRFNLFSIYDKDFGEGASLPSLQDIRTTLTQAGLGIDPMETISVRLLCYPRIFGYAFNPICIYYCYNSSGSLIALVYEVNNTFGDRQCYAFAVDEGADSGNPGIAPHQCDKAMHVSPFTPMDLSYQFNAIVPGERLSIAIRVFNDDGTMMTANFKGSRHALTVSRLARNAVYYPLMTLKVIAGIHWEALRLWIKKVPWFANPNRARPESPG